MASTGQIILPQYNSSGNWDEKLITPESGKVLGFDGSLNPVQLSKQDELISGSNIKTINGTSLLGSGNIVAGTPWTMITLGSQTVSGTVNITGFITTSIAKNQYFAIKVRCGANVVGNSSNFAGLRIYNNGNATMNILAKGTFPVNGSAYTVRAHRTTTNKNNVDLFGGNNSGYIGLWELEINGKWTDADPGTVTIQACASSGTIENATMEYMIW